MSEQSDERRRVYARPLRDESPEVFSYRILKLVKEAGEWRGPEAPSRVENGPVRQ